MLTLARRKRRIFSLALSTGKLITILNFGAYDMTMAMKKIMVMRYTKKVNVLGLMQQFNKKMMVIKIKIVETYAEGAEVNVEVSYKEDGIVIKCRTVRQAQVECMRCKCWRPVQRVSADTTPQTGGP